MKEKNVSVEISHLLIKTIDELGLKKLDRSELESLAATWYISLMDVNKFIEMATTQANIQADSNKALVSEFKSLIRTGEGRGMLGAAHSIGKARQKTISAKNAAKARVSKDPRQKDKASVKDCWATWQLYPNRYRSKAAFAKDMLDKYESLISNKVIEDWCREWEAELQSRNPAS